MSIRPDVSAATTTSTRRRMAPPSSRIARSVMRFSRSRFVLITAGLTLMLACAMTTAGVETAPQAQAKPAQKASTQKPAPASTATTPPGEYVGQETCLGCHDKAYQGTAHGLAGNPRTPAATHGCESCHGPGKAHAESGDKTLIRTFDRNTEPSEISATCTACHNRASHALWEGSQHDQRNLSCVTCHSVHEPVGDHQLKAASQRELCATCHRSVVNKQHRFNHMPVREGGLTCSSCHNVHGSTNVRLLRAGTTIDESCTSCHAEKRGPYLWEHAPVSESCVTCHEPHGSNNERLLVSKLPFLCQRCHVTSRHPPTVYE